MKLALAPVALFIISWSLPAFSVTTDIGEEVIIWGYICIINSLFGIFGYSYCWANPLIAIWGISRISRKNSSSAKRIGLELCLAVASFVCATTFFFETEFPLDEGGVVIGKSIHLLVGFYFWLSATIVASIRSGMDVKTLIENRKQNKIMK